ncbi:expressed unknown protein [Ectocarpus siliculosus]|uniref:Uncharacterized protein n=1 Tax=Ectocarpus siliculosus TaxID=2880 RepID=D8LPQ5_ECTSI|nr:expressed unknown protein [Ectocarpus siliculosus]|eukprot:CBN77360.1 expressed unknown protein [Ectocarpus siliculosus]
MDAMDAMDATMLKVDRLVDGMHGEDPGGARLYMSQIRESETLSMLECFEDMLSGKLPVAPPSSSRCPTPLNIASGGSMAYRVPPSEFLKVLVEGNTTRVGALHAVMQAIGRGDLQGRAASLCISEVRMCLSACANMTGVANGDRGSTNPVHRRMPLAQLRELAGVCLSFSMDIHSATASGRPAPGVYAGGRRGAEDANNRRVLMLQAFPAVLGACCAVAAAEEEEEEEEEEDDDDDDEDEDNDSSEADSDHGDDGEDQSTVERGGGKRGGAAAAAARKMRKGKGKSVGTNEDERRRSSVGDHVGDGLSTGVRGRSRSGKVISNGRGASGGGWSEGGLPQRGEAILWDVTDALLDRPWPLRLALPLLVMFEEIFGLVELLERRGCEARHQAQESGGGAVPGKESVWTRVRSRLMELVWMGGLDGADFTGVIRQVCVLCDTDDRRNYEHDTRHSSPPLREEVSGCDVAPGAATSHEPQERLLPKNGHSERTEMRDGVDGVRKARRGEQTRVSSRGGGWISCLRQLYAAVPPEWVSTVELVLEQTLHQMPGVAESLLDAIQDTSSSSVNTGEADYGVMTGAGLGSSQAERLRSGNGSSSSPTGTGLARSTPTSISHDLALLILLLREASPLRACSLPLLPVGVDRGRRAEEGVRSLLLHAARSGFDGRAAVISRSSGNNQMNEYRGREGALDSTRALLRAVLCSEPGCKGSGSSSGGGGEHRGRGAGSGSSGGVFRNGGESSGVVSERASQLLELALRWLEEGDGGSGGDGSVAFDTEGVGTELNIQDIASETISAVFDAVVEARPRLLRALLSGIYDQSQGGAACAWNYMRAWEALMAQETGRECRRLVPHSQCVSDALGQLTLLPRGRARRVVESMLPLADVCPTQASAMISLCRKCSVQGESKGRLLTLHAVTCILAWNARRGHTGRNGGCLDQEGMQEDLVGMFRRAFEGGLQTVARADALHLLATKLATSVAGAITQGTQYNRAQLLSAMPCQMPQQSHARATIHVDPPPAIDRTALNGLRAFLSMRLFRFFAHKDEVLSADSNADGGGDNSGGPAPSGGYDADSLSRRKGKHKARRRRGGRFQLVPLRLLEERGASGGGHSFGGKSSRGKGPGIVRNGRGRGVVPRDAIGQLLKCCWALVPAGGPTGTDVPDDGAHGTIMPVPEKRAEAEAIARMLLGAGSRRRSEGGGRERGGRPSVGRVSVDTREGEALVAVVEFLQGGGTMETLRMVTPSNQQTPDQQEADDDVIEPPAPAPPACHPGVVSPLTTLGVVVTLAEALADCLLTGISCPRAIHFSRKASRCEVSRVEPADGHHVGDGGDGGPTSGKPEAPLVLWAIADVFTLLAAATRVADGIAAPLGGLSKQPQTRAPEGLSEIISSLPAETLGLSRGSELNATVVGVEEGDDSDSGGAMGERGGATSRRRGGGGGEDASGQSSLLSATSALVFVREFLGWAEKEKGKSPAALVAEGWDGGIGVWLGLVHSVQTLSRALKTTRGNCSRDGAGGVSVGGAATQNSDPCAEAIALAVFQLRTVVGTPSAAVSVVDPSAEASKTTVSSDERSAGAASPSVGHGTARGTHETDSPIMHQTSRRPPPGKMITGFLTKMSMRWKTALPWGLPSVAPPRRTSRRLERRSHRRGGGDGGCGGHAVAGGVKAEAEDLFFALQAELLRSERLVLSILLVGPNASLAQRGWTMRAALASACPRQLAENVEEWRSPPPGTSAASSAATKCAPDRPRAFSRREEPPESGSGPARGAASSNGRVVRATLRKSATLAGGRNGSDAAATEQEFGGKLGRASNMGVGGRRGLVGAKGVREGGEGGDKWNGLGGLCRLAAAEMREGLETGLSVKLSHAYLDLIELLGSAALEHRSCARRTPKPNAAAGPAETSAADRSSEQGSAGACWGQADDAMNTGDGNKEDAGGVLLSIVTCHTVSQSKLFNRLVRGAVRLDGIGISHHPQPPRRTAAASLAELRARDREISCVANHPDGGQGGGGAGCNGANRVEGLRAVAVSPPSLERSTRLLVHCVRWIRARHGNKRGRTAILLSEEDGSESSEEEGVGDGGGDRDRDLPDAEHASGKGKGLSDLRARDGRQSRYSLCPEKVKFASSRECFAAMRTALVECETSLSSVGGVDVGGGGGASSTGNLADVLATVAFCLREFFTPGSTSTRLLLMRVLERVFLVGKGALASASATLAKPSSTATATVVAVRAAPPAPPPLSPPPSSPLPKRRRQQHAATVENGKPGDQAGGAPCRTPAKCGGTNSTERSGGSRAAKDGDSGSGRRPPQSRSVSSSSGRQGKGASQGNGRAGSDAAAAAHSELSRLGQESGMTKAPEGALDAVLAPVLPAVALASGDCLRLMLAARTWAEALRLKSRRGGDDPCRKRASTMLFKIERCELEIGTAAHKTRQFLEHFQDGEKNSAVKAETRSGGVRGATRKRARGGCDKDGGGGDPAKAKKLEPGGSTTISCDENLESALRLLLAGADTVAAWRRDSAAKEKSRAARPTHGGKRGQARRERQQGLGPGAEHEEGDEEEAGGRSNSVRHRFTGASGKRRRSRRARVRSRNVVIDGWLEEGGEEGGNRDDAFVDLEDFIEA